MTARTQDPLHADRNVVPSLTTKVIRSIAIAGLIAATGVVTVSGQPARAANPDRAHWSNEGELAPSEEHPQPAGCWSGAESPSSDLQVAIFWHRSVVASGAWPWRALPASPCRLVPDQ